MLGKLLLEPDIVDVDVDGTDRILRHRQVLSRKTMIRQVFEEFYGNILSLDRTNFADVAGPRVEIGAGSSLFRTADPETQITDIVWSPGLSAVVDAQNMPFPDDSVRTVIGINCFHHFPDPYRFLAEIDRVCKPGGGTILIEPYYGPFAGLLYKRLFAGEDFDKSAEAVSAVGGPMSDANQALSYIVFVREKAAFEQRFPSLEITYEKPAENYVRYLVSGGVNFRQLLPDFLIPSLKGVEFLLHPLCKLFALHNVIVIRKRAAAR